MDILEETFNKHKIWCEIVESFGCNSDTAQDIVSEMYYKIQVLVNKDIDIRYNDSINYFYIFKTLKSLFLDLKRKESKIYLYSLDECQEIDSHSIVELDDKSFDKIYTDLMNALDEMYWYDRKVYELLDGEVSVSKLSRSTGISYYSLYNTFKKAKQYIKTKLL